MFRQICSEKIANLIWIAEKIYLLDMVTKLDMCKSWQVITKYRISKWSHMRSLVGNGLIRPAQQFYKAWRCLFSLKFLCIRNKTHTKTSCARNACWSEIFLNQNKHTLKTNFWQVCFLLPHWPQWKMPQHMINYTKQLDDLHIEFCRRFLDVEKIQNSLEIISCPQQKT